jgi:glycosyltransferase involved in cell wall biosynthesis
VIDAGIQPLVSIIVPCRNHAVALDRCLASLAEQCARQEIEVIVVDSSSDEQAVTVVKRYPGVGLYRSQERLLPGQARNLGASKAAGRYLAFIDADCTAEPGWIAALANALESGSRVVGGAVLQGYSWHPVSIVDNLMQFIDLHPNRARGSADLLPGCNLAIARMDFEALGGFPNIDLPAGEDVLFCTNARSRWPDGNVFEPRMKVRHFGRTGLKEFWLHQECFGFCRGAYALKVQPLQRAMGRYVIITPAVGLKRLHYLLSRATHHPESLALLFLLMPLLLVGIYAWSLGFRRGCLENSLIHRIS